jgi:hypothetical protein
MNKITAGRFVGWSGSWFCLRDLFRGLGCIRLGLCLGVSQAGKRAAC